MTIKYTKHQLTTVDLYYLTLDDAIDQLKKLKEAYPNHTNLRLEYDSETYTFLYGDLPETDIEKEKREKAEEFALKRRKEFDLAEFERLKKKLGKE